MHTYDHMPEPRRQAMQAAVDLLASGVKPAIAATFPLAEAARAHDLVEQRKAIGKIVLKP
jgi:NADPH2:quinone reductase